MLPLSNTLSLHKSIVWSLFFQYDLAYGTKLARIKSEAENILMFETDLVESPAGLPSVSSLDIARLKMAEESKYKATSLPQL